MSDQILATLTVDTSVGEVVIVATSAAAILEAVATTHEQHRVRISAPERPIGECIQCRRHRTRKAICSWCVEKNVAADNQRKRRAAVPGTVLNLGADAFLTALACPLGFTWERYVEADEWFRPGQPGHPAVRLRDVARMTGGDRVGIEIRVVLDGLDSPYSAGTGHTDFDGKTFDRHGVDDSFHVDFDDTVTTLDAKIAEQLTKVAASRERDARSETVPGLPGTWRVTPERKAVIAGMLKAGKGYEFRPAGFGTGYYVVTRPRNGARKALPAATAAFFGLTDTLYYETTDCD